VWVPVLVLCGGQRHTLTAVPHINKPKKPRAPAKTKTKQAVLPQPGGQGTQDQVFEAGVGPERFLRALCVVILF
jgi:hypothetical protein